MNAETLHFEYVIPVCVEQEASIGFWSLIVSLLTLRLKTCLAYFTTDFGLAAAAIALSATQPTL